MAAAFAGPATAAAATTPTCSAPALSQPFLSWGDQNYYTMLPGEAPDSFAGAGWTLSHGAGVVQTRLGDGSTGSVLNLPSGGTAVSPIFCVQSNYPTLRTMVRNLVGSEGVSVYVAYQGTSTWGNPKNTGQVHGQQTNWTLSDPVNLQPNNVPGWQLVQLTLVAGGTTSDFQVYNLWADPYGKG